MSHDVPREICFEYNGETRSALLAGPTSLPTSALPLVVNFHGYSDSPEQQEEFSVMSEDAEQQGVVVAYPRGTGIIKGWNAGACCGAAVTNDTDDVGFAEALVDEIAAVSCIDKGRVYATGYSNGGFLSHRLACESSVFAGVAPVAGVMGWIHAHPQELCRYCKSTARRISRFPTMATSLWAFHQWTRRWKGEAIGSRAAMLRPRSSSKRETQPACNGRDAMHP